MDSSRQDLKTLTNLLISGAAFTFLGKSFAKFIMLLYVIVFSRLLGAEGIGLFFLSFSVFNFAVLIGKMGLQNGLIRYISIYKGSNDHSKLVGSFISSITLSSTSGIIVLLFLYFSSNLISEQLFNDIRLTPLIQRFAFAVPFSILLSMICATFQGLKKPQYSVYSEDITFTIIRFILSILLISHGFGSIGLVNAYSLALLCSLLFAGLLLFKSLDINFLSFVPKLNHRQLFIYSYPLLFIGITQFIISQVDILMVGYFLSAKDVGVYTAAVKIAILLTFTLGAFNSIFPSIIADLHQKKEFTKLKALFQKESELIYAVNYLILLFIIINADIILSLFGSEFKMAFWPLIILCIGWFLDSLAGSCGFLLTMTGNQKVEAKNTIILAGINVLLNTILIPKLGLIGAATATSVSLLLVNLLRLFQVYRKLAIHPFGVGFLINSLVVVITILIVFFLVQFHPLVNKFPAYLNQVLFCIISYGLVFVLYLTLRRFLNK